MPAPRASTVEIIERHGGDRMPEHGPGAVLVPNMVRINGRELWTPLDPSRRTVEVGPIVVEIGSAAVIVPLKLVVVLTDDPDAQPVGDYPLSCAPLLYFSDSEIKLNGEAVWVTEAGVEVLDRDAETGRATVRLALMARRVIVDDELSE